MQKEKTLSTNEVSSDIKKYVRVKQAAEYLGVSTNHVYRLAEKRMIPHYKSRGGKVLYFLLTDLQEYITHIRYSTIRVENASGKTIYTGFIMTNRQIMIERRQQSLF